MKRDIYKYEFMKGYCYWTHHGEEVPVVVSSVIQNEYNRENVFRKQFTSYEHMVMGAAGPSNASDVMQDCGSESSYQTYNVDEAPNENA